MTALLAICLSNVLGIFPVAVASTPPIQSRLLDLSDVPSGWTSITVPMTKYATSFCSKPFLAPRGDTQAVSSFFGPGDGFEEELSTGPSTGSLYDFVVNRLAKCRSVTMSIDHGAQKYVGTGNGLKFPTIGRKSRAFDFNLIENRHDPVGEDVVVFEVGRLVGAVYEIGSHPSEIALAAFATLAVNKATARSPVL